MPGASEDQPSTSTIPHDSGRAHREKRLSALGVGVVVSVVFGSVAGLAGVRTTVATMSSARFGLEVLHASITRPGLATPFSVNVRSMDGPLPDSVTLRVDSEYLEMFDEHGLTPTPASSHSDPDWTWWTFQMTDQRDTLTITLDARLEPSVQWRRSATVALIVDGETVAAADVETWVLP